MEMTFKHEMYKLLKVRPSWASLEHIHDMQNSQNGPKMMLITKLGDKLSGLFTMDDPIIDTLDHGKLIYKLRVSRKSEYYMTNILLPMFVIFCT